MLKLLSIACVVYQFMQFISLPIGPHKRKHSEMDYGSKLSVPSVTDSQKISLSQLAARHSSQSPGKLSKSDSQSHVNDKDRHPPITRDFAQEFHESVLQTTRQQEKFGEHF